VLASNDITHSFFLSIGQFRVDVSSFDVSLECQVDIYDRGDTLYLSNAVQSIVHRNLTAKERSSVDLDWFPAEVGNHSVMALSFSMCN
jgi:hypothetical protein